MTTIRLFANDQDLKIIDLVKLASGNKETVALQVRFSPEWDGYTTSAVFFRSTAPDDIYEMLLTEGRCTIPHEVLAAAGDLVIGIRGATPDAVKVSDRIKYTVVDGAPTGTATAQGPTPDVYQQILEKLNDVLAELPETGGSGGASGTGLWTLIREETLAEDVRTYLCTEDFNGNPFAYDELMITTFQNSTLASSGRMYYHFNGVQCGSPYTGIGNQKLATMFRASRDGMISTGRVYGPSIGESSGGMDNAPNGSSFGMYFPAVASASKLTSAKLETDWWSNNNMLRAGLIVRLWGRNK